MGDVVYEGKAKYLIERPDEPKALVQRFKDDATAFNGEKFAQFEGKGELNCAISSHLFEELEREGVRTHYVERLGATDMLIERLDIVPLEIVVRNRVAGSLEGRIGREAGRPVEPPVVETFYKKDDLGDPILADTHVEFLNLCERDELSEVKAAAREVNDVLIEVFDEAGLSLVDFKMEFGYNSDSELVLGDEISPDTSRIWEKQSDRILDKDVFRKELGDLVEAYEEVAERLGVVV
jgi:phosphoribosylaminoimidazole-succinocarboxamide synthase